MARSAERPERQIWYGSISGNNAAVLEGDMLHVGHLPTNQMAPAYDALRKGAEIRDWFGAAGKVIPVRDIQAIEAIDLMGQLKLGYLENGQRAEIELSTYNPKPLEAVRTLREIIDSDDWEESGDPSPVADALRGPIGLAVIPGLFCGLFAYLASRPRPAPTGDSFNDGFNNLLFQLGPWTFVGLIVPFVVLGILYGIHAVKHRPHFRLRLVRRKGTPT